MKNVFGLNVIFSALTATPIPSVSFLEDSTFNPSPSDVNRARTLRRRDKATDHLDGDARR